MIKSPIDKTVYRLALVRDRRIGLGEAYAQQWNDTGLKKRR